ncbi:MAG TPA: hypothetical protein VHY19_03110 [Steroidobacteraceae bacterium]|jgi:hypothetical protein|nr:hypothetical protein [Steroidobacteraceae bacterium]
MATQAQRDGNYMTSRKSMLTKSQLLALACAVSISMLLPTAGGRGQAHAAEASSCSPVGGLSFVCGVKNVEDMVRVPGTRWLIGSSMRLGKAASKPGAALYLIDTDAKTVRTAALAIEPDKTGPFANCPVPDPTRLGTHGLELRPGKGGVHTLYAINHGGRESLEVFRVDARSATPKIAWTGCIMMPPNTWANSVAAMPDGALAISKFADLNTLNMAPVFRGEITGVTYLWKPGSGFSEVKDGDLSGNNGLLASEDGKTLWVNETGRQRVVRLAVDGSAPPVYAKVGFNPDNLRWAPDGAILVTGQIIPRLNPSLGKDNGWGVSRLDPQTMAVTPILVEPGRPEFSNATVAVRVGKTLWLGSFRTDRIAYLAVK